MCVRVCVRLYLCVCARACVDMPLQAICVVLHDCVGCQPYAFRDGNGTYEFSVNT